MHNWSFSSSQHIMSSYVCSSPTTKPYFLMLLCSRYVKILHRQAGFLLRLMVPNFLPQTHSLPGPQSFFYLLWTQDPTAAPGARAGLPFLPLVQKHCTTFEPKPWHLLFEFAELLIEIVIFYPGLFLIM